MKKVTDKPASDGHADLTAVDEDDELDLTIGKISPALPSFPKEGHRAAHRMALLRATPAFKTDYKKLVKLANKIVSGHITKNGMSPLDPAKERSFGLLVRTFEGKWRVMAFPGSDEDKGTITGFYVWDRHHPTPPFVLDRGAIAAAIDIAIVEPERYAVIDTTMSPKDIRRYLKKYFPTLRGPGNRAYEFEIQPGQYDVDIQIMESNPQTSAELREVATRLDPVAAKSKVDLNDAVNDLRDRLADLRELVSPTPGVVFPPRAKKSP